MLNFLMVAAGLPRTPGAEVRGVPRQGGTGPGREQLRPRTQRSRREWECEGKEAAGEAPKESPPLYLLPPLTPVGHQASHCLFLVLSLPLCKIMGSDWDC